MRFNTKKFRENAEPGIRRLLPESHRQELDRREVANGEIEYSVDGEDWCLYPVMPEWCDI